MIFQQLVAEKVPLKILVITFNMNRKPQTVDLSKMIPNPQQYDLIIFGAQECQMQFKSKFMHQLRQYLNPLQFIDLASVTMFQLFMIAFVRDQHAPFLSHIQTKYKATGYANLIGNKGGLQITFRLYERLYSFICVHLIHGAKAGDKRDAMMGDLIKSLKFSREEIEPDVLADVSFIFGDLNYRLDSTFVEMEPKIDKVIELAPGLD